MKLSRGTRKQNKFMEKLTDHWNKLEEGKKGGLPAAVNRMSHTQSMSKL